MFECQLRQAAHACGCQPWDYPISTRQQFLFCDVFGNICFERMMANSSNGAACRCPMDCSSVSYSYSIVSTPLLPEEECSKDGKDSIFEEFYKGRCRQKMHILISLHFVIKPNRLDDNDLWQMSAYLSSFLSAE